MILLYLIIGCLGFFLSGSALTRFKDTHEYQWAAIGVSEIFAGIYFIVVAIGNVAIT